MPALTIYEYRPSAVGTFYRAAITPGHPHVLPTVTIPRKFPFGASRHLKVPRLVPVLPLAMGESEFLNSFLLEKLQPEVAINTPSPPEVPQ